MTGGNTLLSADGGNGGEGSKLWIDPGFRESDYVLTAGESVTVRFRVRVRVGLATRNGFTFTVDVEAITPP